MHGGHAARPLLMGVTLRRGGEPLPGAVEGDHLTLEVLHQLGQLALTRLQVADHVLELVDLDGEVVGGAHRPSRSTIRAATASRPARDASSCACRSRWVALI